MEEPDHLLVDGWTLEQLAAEAGVNDVALLDPQNHHVVEITRDPEDLSYGYSELDPQTIISVHGLCLIRETPDRSWLMGQIDDDDGSIVCWGDFGSDLLAAIKAL